MTFYTVNYTSYRQKWKGTRWQYETFEDALAEASTIARNLIDGVEYVRLEIFKHKGVPNNVKPAA